MLSTMWFIKRPIPTISLLVRKACDASVSRRQYAQTRTVSQRTTGHAFAGIQRVQAKTRQGSSASPIRIRADFTPFARTLMPTKSIQRIAVVARRRALRTLGCFAAPTSRLVANLPQHILSKSLKARAAQFRAEDP